jgi:cyclopropane-fatty-acyl-phospholipid synthase
MDGEWSCDDLTGVIRILARNARVTSGLDSGLGRLAAPVLRAYHSLRRNTRAGSARNIHEHYDLGNDFFELFLDRTLTYSCGLFERDDATLEEASIAKYDRLCRKLELGPDDHVLEIGTGWGGFAMHAAGRYGCRVTTTTISEQQHDLACERIAAAGLANRVTVLKRDYRDLEGTFDKLVSIEMIEAVGDAYLDGFFQVCAERLKPDGMMGLQAITTPDQTYDRHVNSVDFIKRYIFPGGSLVSIGRIAQAVARVTDLRMAHLEDITPHYATTLRGWRERFFKNLDQVRALGYPERFVRMWEFYLCYCEGGFLERAIGDVQIVLAKPLCRRDSILV